MWDVSRSLRWPHYRGVRDFPDVPYIDGGGDDALTGLLLAIVIAILVAVAIVILLPAILLVVESAFVVVASVAFSRAWRVTAQTLGPPPEIREWRVRGLLRSRAAVREVADELRRGVPAEPEHALR